MIWCLLLITFGVSEKAKKLEESFSVLEVVSTYWTTDMGNNTLYNACTAQRNVIAKQSHSYTKNQKQVESSCHIFPGLSPIRRCSLSKSTKLTSNALEDATRFVSRRPRMPFKIHKHKQDWNQLFRSGISKFRLQRYFFCSRTC